MVPLELDFGKFWIFVLGGWVRWAVEQGTRVPDSWHGAVTALCNEDWGIFPLQLTTEGWMHSHVSKRRLIIHSLVARKFPLLIKAGHLDSPALTSIASCTNKSYSSRWLGRARNHFEARSFSNRVAQIHSRSKYRALLQKRWWLCRHQPPHSTKSSDI